MEAGIVTMWQSRQVGLHLSVICLLSALLVVACGDSIDVQAARDEQDRSPRKSVVALARLEPASRVVDVASAKPDVIKQVLVREGNEVIQGQVLVLLLSLIHI